VQVVCTIHQPSSEIFSLFDDVFWLANGSLVYSGPVPQLTSYFAKQGYPCPQFTNPSDFYMRLISRSEDLPEEKYVARITRLEGYHQAHNNILPIDGHTMTLRRASSTHRSGVSYSKQEEGDNVDDSGKETYEVEFKNEKLPKLKKASPRFPTQVWLLLSRSWKQYIRDSGTKAPRVNTAVLDSLPILTY
jgi:ABC-type multidrug transport system ATPase subunit